jgi:hypothetical protein
MQPDRSPRRLRVCRSSLSRETSCSSSLDLLPKTRFANQHVPSQWHKSIATLGKRVHIRYQHKRRAKRWRATAVQDAGAFAAAHSVAKRRGVLHPSGAVAQDPSCQPTCPSSFYVSRITHHSPVRSSGPPTVAASLVSAANSDPNKPSIQNELVTLTFDI